VRELWAVPYLAKAMRSSSRITSLAQKLSKQSKAKQTGERRTRRRQRLSSPAFGGGSPLGTILKLIPWLGRFCLKLLVISVAWHFVLNSRSRWDCA